MSLLLSRSGLMSLPLSRSAGQLTTNNQQRRPRSGQLLYCSCLSCSREARPLTDFKRSTPEFLRQLKKTGAPVVLTINGKAALVVQDAASYQRLFELAERLETIQVVEEGLASVDRGEGKPMEDVFSALEMDLGRTKRR